MPVTVKLLELVALPDSRKVWPADFEALVAKLEEKPQVKAQWGVIADWCDENGEPELGTAFRFMTRPQATVIKMAGDVNWTFRNLPDAVRNEERCDADRETIPGKMASLFGMIERAREKARKQLEELS